jgi:hypothetical protein
VPTDDELLDQLASALTPPDREAPADRVAALRAAADQRAATAGGAAPDEAAGVVPLGSRRTARAERRRSRTGRIAALAVGAAAAAGAFVLGDTLLRDARDPTSENLLAGGTLEFETTLQAPDGDATAQATGILTGIGRTVQLRTDDLAILPKGEFYELWFVGPGDSPRSPNRISAGTFHPDDAGRSFVDLTAAVDPALYPELSVTAEPGDGDPRATGPEVLRADIELLDS